MIIKHTPVVGGLALSLALAGCLSTPVAQAPMDRLEAQVVGPQALTKTRLTFTVIDESAKQAQGYKVNYIRVLDWDTVRATLYKVKDDGTGSYVKDSAFTDVSRDKAASVSTSDLVRSAVLTLSNLTPDANYCILVELIKNVDGSERVIAEGSNTGTGGAGFAIAEGPNTVTVNLSLTANGEAIVNVPEPGISTTLSTTVSTESKMSVARFAGTDITSYTVAPGATDLFEPAGIEMNASGETFVADSKHHQILKYATDGTASVFAGTATAGSTGDGGAASAATLNQPRGLAYVPSQDTLYLADSANHRVRMVDETGTIFNVAGGGATYTSTTPVAGADAAMRTPTGLAIDSTGNVYVSEYVGDRINKIDLDGKITQIAGSQDRANALAIDRTNKVLWFSTGDTIKAITSVDTAPSAPVTVYTASSTYNEVHGLAYDHNGNLYAAIAGDTSSTYSRRYNNKIFRLPVKSDGTIETGKSAEVLAGYNFTTSSSPYGSVGTASTANALEVALAGPGFAGLFLDMRDSASAGTLGGHLLMSQWNYNNGWGQVIKLTPHTLN